MEQRLFGRALAGSQFVDERVLMNSYIYNEYLRPKMDVHYIAGSVVQLDGGCIGVIGTHRPHDAHDFSRGKRSGWRDCCRICSAPCRSGKGSSKPSKRAVRSTRFWIG
jgi:hypothetical protein